MWPVKPPGFDAGDTYETCIGRVRDADLRRRLRAVSPVIKTASEDYKGSCPVEWCRIGQANHHDSQQSGRDGQAATAGRLTMPSSPSGAMVSRLM